MRRIDEYVDSIYAHLDWNEAKELKDEMRSHLFEAVKELIVEGKAEEEAVRLALERFGDERMLRSQVSEYFQLPRIFAVNLLRTAVFFAILGLLIGCAFVYNEYRLNEQRQTVIQEIFHVLDADQNISDEKMKTLSDIAKVANQIKSLEVARANTKFTDRVFTYNHPQPFRHLLYWNATAGVSESDGKWEIGMSYEHYQLAWINAIVVCLAAYWVLFALWAIMQGYRNHKLRAIWIIIISLFNFPAYLLYRATLK